ncbi:MAG: DUF1858 domain-containing protein [Candidatus Krumholzibacteriia bacterium]
MSITIDAETRVGDLLRAHPELEEVLIAQAPAFAKLRNPVLRRTVAKVATLRAAAQMAGVDVEALVRVLRQAAAEITATPDPAPGVVGGEEADSRTADRVEERRAAGPPAGSPAGPPAWPPARPDPSELGPTAAPPAWARDEPVEVLHVDDMLARGEHPLGRVQKLLRGVAPDRYILLRSSFRPEPLIEAVGEAGHETHCRAVGPDDWETYLRAGRP